MTPLLEHPRYVEAMAEFNRLGAALGRIDARLAEIALLGRDLAAGNTGALLLAGLDQLEKVGTLPTAQSLAAERSTLADQRAMTVAILEQSRTKVYVLVGELSNQVTAEMSTRHKALAVRMLKALRDLDAIQDEEDTLIRELAHAGYEARFAQRIDWPHVGRLADSSGSALWYRTRDLQRYVA